MLQLARLIRHGGIGLLFVMLTRIGINDLALGSLTVHASTDAKNKHEPDDRFSSSSGLVTHAAEVTRPIGYFVTIAAHCNLM